MKRALLVLGLCVATTLTLLADDTKESKEVTVGDLKLKIPTAWKKEKPSSSLRLGQFAIPAVKGEKLPGELTVFFFGGTSGTPSQNIQRWIQAFASSGRKAGVVKGKSKLGDYYLVEISGSYNRPIGPPRQRKTKLTPNSRMLGVILQVQNKGSYYLKLTGPDKTVAKAVDGLRSSFGGNKKSEKKTEF